MGFLEMRGITKRYPGVTANDDITISVEKGEIHALVGENGAGKSTLMRILYGMERPDSGDILLDGRPVSIRSPQDAISLGIGMVHQKFKLIPSMTVAENVVLGLEPRKGIKFSFEDARRITKDLSERFSLNLDADARVCDLSAGEQQRIEIMRLLYRDAEILIFDEATSVLAPREARDLFVTLKKFAAQGKTIVYITHKIDEVMEIADRVTALRRGKVVGTKYISEITPAELAVMMVGSEVPPESVRKSPSVGKPVLEISDLVVKDAAGVPRLNRLSLTVHAGEVVGIAGIEGNGQLELAEAILGLRQVTSGSILLDGHDITRLSVRQRRMLGLSFIPHDRYRLGVNVSESIADNLIATQYFLPEFSQAGVLKASEVNAFAQQLIEAFGIKAVRSSDACSSLSGGNIQKVVVARELAKKPVVLVATHPTHGLDVKATAFIRDKLVELASMGAGVLLISPDLDEILQISDTVAVVFKGRVVFVSSAAGVSKEVLGLYMTTGGNTAEALSGNRHSSGVIWGAGA